MKNVVIVILFIMILMPATIVAQSHASSQMQGQETVQNVVEIIRARVVEVMGQERRQVPGTDVQSVYQTIKAEILEGDQQGVVITIENDFLVLKKGDAFFLRHSVDGLDGKELYAVRDIDRRGVIAGFVVLFAVVIVVFSGKQGVRSLVSLAGSLFVILYVLVPSLLRGYPPVYMSIAVATVILFFAIYFTHGFNKESTVAFMGTVAAVVLTGILAYLGVTMARLSGFASDEVAYLNFSTRGMLDLAGLLLGGIMIGVLGVLDDIAVTQAAVVSEIYNSAPHLSRADVYRKALRVGREHVGALVNTLALAYTGASLPLLLLFSTSDSSLASIINQEVFATEIIRTVIGSIGLILTVPITTLLAVYMLKGYKSHHHVHSHTHN